MWKLLLRIAVIVLAVLVGVGTLFWVFLWLAGFGASFVVLKNVDAASPVQVSVIQVSETGREVLDESAPIRIGAGDTEEIELEHRGDSELRIRVVDAQGGTRHYDVHVYLGGTARTIVIEIAGGRVKGVRAREGPLTDYRDAPWTADEGGRHPAGR
jgi:hypothetical protein